MFVLEIAGFNMETEMSRPPFRFIMLLTLCLAVANCARPLPPSYMATSSKGVVDGPILAIAGEGDLVAAANPEGLYIKRGDGPWQRQEIPGVRKLSKITCLAVLGNTIYVGSDGEGLHILSDGTWEVRASRYGGLPDDGVLSIAVDGADEGLPGVSLWVGTRTGIAGYRDGEWTTYQPGRDWLVTMTGESGLGTGKVFVSSGFKLGLKGGDSKQFRPPISAISVGPDRVVFGNQNSALAIVSGDSVAIFRFAKRRMFTVMQVGEDVIWAGTETGLLWGGLSGRARGKPWPVNRTYDSASATLYGSRNSQPFEYRWKLLGYNNARVVGLARPEGGLWTAYRAGKDTHSKQRRRTSTYDESMSENPVTVVRFFLSIDEYIARRQTPQFENYSTGTGIRGDPTALYVAPEGGTVWVGTTGGLWELKQ